MTDNVQHAATAQDPLVEIATQSQSARHTHTGARLALGLAALGVVFGDIGTSPLYALQTVFSIEHGAVKPTTDNIYGVISMVFWAITIIVSVKYVTFVMRAGNEGEGGILALVALLKDKLGESRSLVGWAVLMGIIGAGLFYGDSVITPAISVMSAIEGLHIVSPALEEFVLPLSVAILTGLFVIQRFGTGVVGKAFGPIMLAWFFVLGVLGIPHIVSNPAILAAISPHYAAVFVMSHPFIAFVAMGAVVLTITGAEALYADMGHFGANPIRGAWFFVVFPALALNYFGQGAMILRHPEFIDNPFFRLVPGWATIPLIILATIATVIASQAVISGTFSVSRQANRLRLLPRLSVKHTSRSEGGQIYIASINWILFIGVLLLISVFQSSTRLASAYGLAVTGTLTLTTVLFLFYAYHVRRWPLWALIAFAVPVGGLELMVFAASLLKFFAGGWIPLVIGALVVVIMTTWRRGTRIITQRQELVEGSLDDFISYLQTSPAITRVPGFAVYPHRGRETVPLALKASLQSFRAMHEQIVIINVVNENVPHIRHVEREHLDNLGFDDGICYVDCHVGFNDSQDIPKAIRLAIETFPQLSHLDEETATYFVSVGEIKRAANDRMPTWRKRIYLGLAHNQADATAYYHTPKERTVVLGAELYL